MQNMEDGTMNSFSTSMSLGGPKTTHESPDDYNHDYSHITSSTRRSAASKDHRSNRNRSEWASISPSQKRNEWINNTGADSMWGQTKKGNETNTTTNPSQKEYFRKI